MHPLDLHNCWWCGNKTAMVNCPNPHPDVTHVIGIISNLKKEELITSYYITCLNQKCEARSGKCSSEKEVRAAWNWIGKTVTVALDDFKNKK